MRVIYAGTNFFSSCLEALVNKSDVDVALCLTDEPQKAVDNVVRLAHLSGAPVLFGKPDRAAVDAINNLRPDLLVCAGYLYRIPFEELTVPRAVNIHPTMLPEGRGPHPLPYLLEGNATKSGVSIHEMTSEVDQGPLLLQERIDVYEGDGFYELSLKVYAVAPRLLRLLLEDIDQYFAEKRPQSSGSYWPAPSDEQRSVIAATAHVSDVKTRHRRFGPLGTIIHLNDGSKAEVFYLTASECTHSFTPGTVVGRTGDDLIVAVVDGLVRIHDPKWF